MGISRSDQPLAGSAAASRPPVAAAAHSTPRAPVAPPAADGERLLLAADAIARDIEPDTATIERIGVLLACAAPACAARFEDVEQFFCALQLALAEGRLGHVAETAGLFPPGLERVKLALQAYLDFTLRHCAVARLCAKARGDLPRLAELVQQRNAGVVLLISVELSSLRWKRPQECARLLQAALTDVAATEILECGPNEKLRGGLAACAQALAEGFAPPRNQAAPKRADA